MLVWFVRTVGVVAFVGVSSLSLWVAGLPAGRAADTRECVTATVANSYRW
ncbi:hypothetical protein [Streptomyces purpureus]|nr:hypothetical protein [Streptomyces purpureus]